MTIEDMLHRFRNHPPKNDEVAQTFENITLAFTTIAGMLDDVLPPSREASLAITNLEQASMWAKAAVARNQ